MKRANDSLGRDGWRVHLTGRRVAEWCGLANYGGKETGSATWRARQAMLKEWHKPRDRNAPKTGRPNPRFQYGQRNEQYARDAYLAFTGIDPALVQRGYFREHPEAPWVGATPDLLVGDNGMVELKCPWPQRDDDGADCPLRTEWLVQCYVQLEVFGREWCDLVAWNEDHLWLWRLYRDRVEYHEPLQVEQTRTDAAGVVTTSTLLSGPQTAWNVILPELRNFQSAVEGQTKPGTWLDMPVAVSSRLRTEMAAYRRNGVAQLCVPTTESGDGVAWSTHKEMRNNPDLFTLVDRVANPLAPSRSPFPPGPFAERFLNVHYTNAEHTTFWCYQRDGFPRPNGGVVRPEYHTCYLTSAAAPDTLSDNPVTAQNMPRGAIEWGVAMYDQNSRLSLV